MLEFDCRTCSLVVWLGCEFVVVVHRADWSWKQNNELMWDSVCVFLCNWYVPSSSLPLMMSSALQVKVTQELKNTHTEQLGRLHLKHQTECDLLEDMR